jgi:recombination protein RecT
MTDTKALDRMLADSRPIGDLPAFLDLITPKLTTALPSHLGVESMISIVEAFAGRDNRLAQCTPRSVLNSLMLCAQRGLPPNTEDKYCWLIPYYNNRKKIYECKVMWGYKGLAQLVRNSGTVARMNAGVAYQYEITAGTFAASHEPPAIKHDLNPVGDRSDNQLALAYCVVMTMDGERHQRILLRDEVLKRRDASQAVQRAKREKKRTPWDDWEPSMWRKTGIRACMDDGLVPTSTEIREALAADIDSPQFVEAHQVAPYVPEIVPPPAPPPAQLPASDEQPPAPETDAADKQEPPPQDEPPPADEQPPGPGQPKMATKAQCDRAWQRWAKIMGHDTSKRTAGPRKDFGGFVAHLVGEAKGRDSALWTIADVAVINKALNKLRDSKPGDEPPPDPEPDPEPEQAADPAEQPEDEPGLDQKVALKQLKETRAEFGWSWEQLRVLARGLGIQGASSAKWTATECTQLEVAMRAASEAAKGAGSQEEGADPEPAP